LQKTDIGAVWHFGCEDR